MRLTHHLGYGRFQLQDLLPGEEFARYDGSLAKVCEKQIHRTLNPTTRHLHLPAHIAVWIHHGTSNAARAFLHRSALAYALTPEQARRIAARVLKRKKVTSMTRFSLGQIVATPNALRQLSRTDIVSALRRHQQGEWGDIGGHDRQANDQALRDGSRLLSAYHGIGGIRFWIITEADRSATTILLPEDY